MVKTKEELRAAAEAIINKAEAEGRKLSEQEEKDLADLRNQITEASKKAMDQGKSVPSEPRNEASDGNLTFLRAIRAIATGEQTEELRDLSIRGKEELLRAGVNSIVSGSVVLPTSVRSTLAATTGTGTKIIETDKADLLAPLRSKSVLVKAGATMLTGLTGNLSLPRYSGSEAKWADETEAVSEGGGTFDTVDFAPKRLTTVLEISEQLLLQDSVSAQQVIERDLIAAIQAKLEATALGSGAGSTKQPKGLFNGTISDKGAISWDRVIGMEEAVDTANALEGSLAFITHPKGKTALRTTKRDIAGNGFICDDARTVDGYPLYTTTGVATDVNTNEIAIAFANWQEFYLCQWGGIAIKRDDLTKAAEGVVRLIVNTYWDFGFRRPGVYTLASIKVK